MVSAAAGGDARAARGVGDGGGRVWHPLAGAGRGSEHGGAAGGRAGAAGVGGVAVGAWIVSGDVCEWAAGVGTCAAGRIIWGEAGRGLRSFLQ